MRADTVLRHPQGRSSAAAVRTGAYEKTMTTQPNASQASTDDRASRWRGRAYPGAALVVLAAVIVVAVVTTEPGESRVGGDYPAFFAAGELARAGDWEAVYDPAAQREAQRGLVDDTGGFLYFAYPPFVAAAYGVTTRLGYSFSFLLQVGAMAAALAIAIRLTRHRVASITAAPLAAYALALFFYPMLVAVIGGQNTALTLLLIVAAAWAEAADREWLAGMAVGLMFYKPQFAVPLLLLLLVARRWRGLGGALGTGAALWVTGALLMGTDWVGTWWSEATAFADTNARVNGALFVSLPGVLQQLAGDVGEVAGWALAVVVMLTLAGIWWRLGGTHPWIRYGAAAAGLVLVLPQPLFYEAGLLVLPLALLWENSPMRRGWVIALWASAWLQVAAGGWDVSPLIVTVAVTFVWFVVASRPSLRDSATPTRTTPV